MIAYDKFINKYFINLDITAETPLHIGSSNDGLSPLDVDNSVIRDSKNNVLIPGSSLKGVFRSTLESLLRDKENLKICEDTDTCIDPKLRKKIKGEEEWFNHIEENICEICNLFGSNSFASRVVFSDAKSQGKVNVEIRDGIKIRRDTEITANSAKFDYEIVSAGTKFETEILLDNVENFQIGYITLIIDMINNGLIRFGGKKSAGLGKLSMKYTLKKITSEDIFKGNFEPVSLNEDEVKALKQSAIKRISKEGEKNV